MLLPSADPTLVQVRPSGPTTARIMIVGEAPGDNEVQSGEPFVGQSGQELNKMLHEAGIMRSECFVTNVCRQQPPGNDIDRFMPVKRKDINTQVHIPCRDRMVMPCVKAGLQLLTKEIELVKPTVIIALGNVSLWALTGEWGITEWRGSQLVCDLVPGLAITVLPTYHPAGVLRQWTWRATAVHDLRKAARWAVSGGDPVPRYNFITRPSFDQVLIELDTMLARAKKAGLPFETIPGYEQLNVGGGDNRYADPLKLAIDLETRAGHIACIGIAQSATFAICIPFMCIERKEGYWSEEQEAIILHRLYQLLTHPNVLCIGQNFLYDCQYIYRHWHFIPRAARDTMLSQHACFSNLPKGLGYLSSMYCAHHVYWKDEGKEWDKHTGEDQLWVYNCKDAVKTWEIDGVQQSVVDKMGLRKVHDFQQSLFFPVLKTMLRGVAISLKSRSDLASLLQEEMAKRKTWLVEVLGHDLNPRSPPQMQRLFYDDLRQPKIWKRPKGKATKATLTLDDEALWKLATREPLLRPLAQKISEYRSLGVFFGTFVSAPLDHDGRMRCAFNIAGTETYRFSSSENAFGSGTNLQNVPSGGDNDSDRPDLELPNVRKLFIPDYGKFFWDIDLSQADLRIVVWESRCEEMKQMLREGYDPYLEVAKEFYRDPSLTKQSPKRQLFKSFCHGTHYLGTAKGLASRLGLLVHEAERTQAWYLHRFKAIKTWQDDFKAQVEKRRYVQNVFGHRIYVFDRLEGNTYNELAAWLPQSTVGILINHAYVNIDREVPEAEVLLQVHDSLAGQGPIELRDSLIERITRQSSIELPYEGDPLIIPVGIKTSTSSWGDCE